MFGSVDTCGVRSTVPKPRKLTLSLYLTLDGYNEFPAYPGSEPTSSEPDLVAEAMWIQRWNSMDTLLYDRETYEQWAEFWPLSKRTPGEHPWFRQMSEFAEGAQKVVLSDSKTISPWARSRVLGGDIEDALEQLRREPGKDIVLVAPGLGRELMRRGLIDEYLFAISPVILGKGHQFFGSLDHQQTLRLAEVKKLPAGELFLRYETVR
jgi:dihydrofolate reductase